MNRKRKLEDRQAATVAGRSKGGAGKSVGGASRGMAGRLGRRVGRQRKLAMNRKGCRMVGRQRKLEVDRRANPRRLVGGASRGQTGWLAVGSDADIQSEVELEGDAVRLAVGASWQPTQVGSR
jgi:hypothetical protein